MQSSRLSVPLSMEATLSSRRVTAASKLSPAISSSVIPSPPQISDPGSKRAALEPHLHDIIRIELLHPSDDRPAPGDHGITSGEGRQGAKSVQLASQQGQAAFAAAQVQFPCRSEATVQVIQRLATRGD